MCDNNKNGDMVVEWGRKGMKMILGENIPVDSVWGRFKSGDKGRQVKAEKKWKNRSKAEKKRKKVIKL